MPPTLQALIDALNAHAKVLIESGDDVEGGWALRGMADAYELSAARLDHDAMNAAYDSRRIDAGVYQLAWVSGWNRQR